ncbi:uncharacterized protein LOC112056746 [Bicyclus anynana]|uniref:Uncharacterized protein LOC112056746 n=1 Tax=Bicyclus anynana TaxID=110368 RepID=A0ABM3LXY7_BICAN|nr:uncharacterized protein LOC112056746 [Bicyclus anynana]
MLLILFLLNGANSYRLPGSCALGYFYEPSLMDCLACPGNTSLVTAADGFGCSCEEHSIPVDVIRCRPCNITEVVASDGRSCVPRRCQSSAGRISCRKCPRDYISVTQNFDGSPMKEVQCIKCSRGFKAVDNRCVRCEACSCAKHEVMVKDKCIPKKYVMDRPKYTENRLHPDELLEIVKLEYLCTQQDIRACRSLASWCVRNFYTPELTGPCRLWLQPKLIHFKGNKSMFLILVQVVLMYLHTLRVNDAWSTGGFRKFFLLNRFLSTTTNTTSVVYLRTLDIRVIVKRDTSKVGYLRLGLAIEAQYDTPDSSILTTTLRVGHDMPEAGVTQGLQIWGGVVGVLMVLYGLVQWRGVVRRGGSYLSLVPLITSSVSDALHFAPLLATLHALTAEAGTLGLTLPLSQAEEEVIAALVYTCVSLKNTGKIVVNIVYFIETSLNEKSNVWKTDLLLREWMSLQTKRRVLPGYTVTCTLLVLHFLSPWQSSIPKSAGYKWVVAMVTWWCSYTALLCTRILVDRLVEPCSTRLVKVCTDLEMSVLVFQEECYAHYINGRNENSMDLRSMTHPLSSCRVVCAPQVRCVNMKQFTKSSQQQKPQSKLNKILILREERPQTNSTTLNFEFISDDITEGHSNREILTQFLAAFFERALDGLNWVASERTILEKLLDVEFVAREGGNTSILLYDADVTTPSCLAVTWWGEEWMLAPFDAMIFGCVLMASEQTLLAGLVTLIVWKVMDFTRMLCGNWNVKRKINLTS